MAKQTRFIMGRKNNKEYKVINVFANGDVVTLEDLKKNPRHITYENNKEVYEALQRTFHPAYREEESRKRRREIVAARKAALLEELKNLE